MNVLVTGRPGIGKTTVLMKLLEELGGVHVDGFYTGEIRKGKQREGFELVSLDGKKMTLAHIDMKSPHRVGRYGVDVEGFEDLLGSLDLSNSPAEVVLVDEIGKMECFSKKFTGVMGELLDSDRIVVATVAERGPGFIDEVKRRPDCELFTVTGGNRNELPRTLARRTRTAL